MKKITVKNIVALFILITMLFSAFPYVSAEEHWASEVASSLVDDGIVSGYDDGSLRLDNTITRAEFVKIINKSRKLTSKADVNFPDVDEDKWYFEEMLIAKGNGYLTGDDKGNSNPESNITRAEASVIIARILGLDISDLNCSATDTNEIPSWAKGAVNALLKAGIIKGYSDGTFKANNSLTRGEGFTLIYNLLNTQKEKEEEKAETPTTQGSYGNMFTGGSSGGGGGSSGGGARPVTPPVRIAETPAVRYNPDNGYKIEWDKCQGADKYVIYLRLKEENSLTYAAETTDTSMDLLSALSEYVSLRNNAQEEFLVSVMSKGMIGYNDSAYSVEIPVTVSFECIDAPVLSARYGKANNVKKAAVNWEEIVNASSYDVKVTVDDIEKTLGTDYTVDLQKREVFISDASFINDNTYIYVTALSVNPALYKNSQVTALKLGEVDASSERDGLTKETAWIITSSEDFAKIGQEGSKYLLSHHYEIQNDITVTKPIGSDETPFTGSITGKKNGTGYKPTVTLNITEGATKESSGLVARLNGGEISNLEIKGKIELGYEMDAGNSAPRGVGAIAGVMDGGKISDIINRASVSNNHGNASKFSCVGGIVGKTVNSSLEVIENCRNYGFVDGNRGTGGIVGVAKGTNIISCTNYATVGNSTNAQYTGGICGDFRGGKVSTSANYGEIITYASYSGGLLGLARPELSEIIISDCFNKGKITGAKSLGGIAGIVQYNSASAQTTTISDCFNEGVFSNVDYAGGIVGYIGHASNPNKLIMSNCYATSTVSVIADSLNDENDITSSSVYFMGTADDDYAKAITDDKLKTLLNDDISFDNEKWQILSDFDYPQLVNNSYSKVEETVPEITNLVASYQDNSITFSWALPEDVSSVTVKIYNNSKLETILPDTVLTNVLNSYILDNVTEGDWYEIYITVDFNSDKESISVNKEFAAQ